MLGHSEAISCAEAQANRKPFMEDQEICRTAQDRKETARSAYWFWEKHGCPPGGNLAFWLQMERAHAALKPKLGLSALGNLAALPAKLPHSFSSPQEGLRVEEGDLEPEAWPAAKF